MKAYLKTNTNQNTTTHSTIARRSKSRRRLDAKVRCRLRFDRGTRIMINKGMFNKGKYWIYGKNKGVSVSNLKNLRVVEERCCPFLWI